MGTTFIELSHPIEEGLITYPGLPAPKIREYISREQSRKHYAPGTEFHIGKIEMVANTGTYIDSPFHRYSLGKDLSQTPLISLANLESVVVRVAGGLRAVDTKAFEGLDMREKAVLVHTGWDRHWGTEQYFSGHPFLTKGAAEHLLESGAKLVGIDSLNIDNTEDPTRPVHSLLLAAEIPIVEHLCNLVSLPENGFRFFAVPPLFRNIGSFPVRAFAIIQA